jgi:hypothetical protein
MRLPAGSLRAAISTHAVGSESATMCLRIFFHFELSITPDSTLSGGTFVFLPYLGFRRRLTHRLPFDLMGETGARRGGVHPDSC